MTLKQVRAEYENEFAMATLALAEQSYAQAVEHLTRAIDAWSAYCTLSSPETKAIRQERLITLSALVKHVKARAANHESRERLKSKANPNPAKKSCKFLLSEQEIPDISFEDVVGLEDVKRNIMLQVINPYKYPDLYRTFRKRTGGGILLYGPPGNGKTMIAKAIAHETGAQFYLVRASELLSKWVGESESNIHDMFAHARQQERAVIFLDEVEALTLNRHSSGDSACYAGIIAQLLTEIQGFEDGEGNLMLIAATNKPWAIDPAFLRPGRFDEKIYVPLPDEESRRHMFDVKMTGVPTLDLDYAELARLTPHFSGADIDHLCEKVKGIVIEALIAGEARPDRITMEDYRQALQGIQRSVTSAEEQALTQWRLDDGSSFSRRAV